jgi:hypothetical protein
MNPFNPNIIFTISEIEEDNPFNPILGEGGYNSGKKIKPSHALVPIGSDERRDLINANSQRTYRNRNREAYNANMLKLWRRNKESQNSSYENWKERQKEANKRYRLKKKLISLEEDKFEDKTTIPKKVKDEVNKEWNLISKPERKKLKMKKWKEDRYKTVYEKLKLNEIEKIKSELKNNTEINKGKFNREKNLDGLEVNSSIKDGEYAQADYNRLQIGPNPDTQNRNLIDLDNYYKTVITKINPNPQSVKFTNTKINVVNARNKHRNILEAGDWTLKGDYKRSIAKKSGRNKEETYEGQGKNKI